MQTAAIDRARAKQLRAEARSLVMRARDMERVMDENRRDGFEPLFLSPSLCRAFRKRAGVLMAEARVAEGYERRFTKRAPKDGTEYGAAGDDGSGR